jgi:hypothetical protein
MSAIRARSRRARTSTSGLQLYGYPDNESLTDASYFEPYAAVRHTLGPVTAELGAAYAPEQEALANNDSLYVHGGLSGGIPFTPVTIRTRVGYTSGPARFTGFGDYLDWRIGAEYTRGPATLILEYVDTDIPMRGMRTRRSWPPCGSASERSGGGRLTLAPRLWHRKAPERV